MSIANSVVNVLLEAEPDVGEFSKQFFKWIPSGQAVKKFSRTHNVIGNVAFRAEDRAVEFVGYILDYDGSLMDKGESGEGDMWGWVALLSWEQGVPKWNVDYGLWVAPSSDFSSETHDNQYIPTDIRVTLSENSEEFYRMHVLPEISL